MVNSILIVDKYDYGVGHEKTKDGIPFHGEPALILNVFIEFEMLEITDGSVYRVKNFAKHQNIKVKEKIKSENKEHDVKNTEAVIKEMFSQENLNNAMAGMALMQQSYNASNYVYLNKIKK